VQAFLISSVLLGLLVAAGIVAVGRGRRSPGTVPTEGGCVVTFEVEAGRAYRIVPLP